MNHGRVHNRRSVKYSLLCVVALGLFARPTPATAQDRWPITLEAHVGGTRGHSDNNGRYRGARDGLWAEILAGARLHSADRAGPFIALGAGVHALNTVRTLDCAPAPGGGCVPWFPGFGAVSLLGGWESRSTNLRLLGGPGLVSSDDEEAAGIVGRFDAALPLLEHISTVASLNALVVPSWNGDRFYHIAIGVGLRVR
jgi:hypothetical protein